MFHPNRLLYRGPEYTTGQDAYNALTCQASSCKEDVPKAWEKLRQALGTKIDTAGAWRSKEVKDWNVFTPEEAAATKKYQEKRTGVTTDTKARLESLVPPSQKKEVAPKAKNSDEDEPSWEKIRADLQAAIDAARNVGKPQGTPALSTTVPAAPQSAPTPAPEPVFTPVPEVAHVAPIAPVLTAAPTLTNTVERFPSEEYLEKISEGQYISPEKIDTLLHMLGASLPPAEIQRLRGLLPKEMSEENKRKLQNLKDNTEDKAPPLIMQIPKVFVLDGKEIPFTPENLKTAWDQAQQHNEGMHGMFFDRWVRKKSMQKTWDGKLRAYTSGCLEGTRGKHYNEGADNQLAIQKKILGENSEIDEGMFIAMLFRYLDSGKKERLMLKDYMRLNAWGTDGDPLCIYSYSDLLVLGSTARGPDSVGGVGGSLGISS